MGANPADDHLVEALQSWAPPHSRSPVQQLDPATLLLETLRSASEASTLPEDLGASQVNQIAKSLGFNDTQLLGLLARLSESGNVELRWGGNVKVVRPKTTGHSIHLERGATLVQNSEIGGGSAIGSHAMAAGAVRGSGPANQDQLEATAKLTAAITLMSDSLSHLEGETRKQVQNAVEQAQEILPSLRADKPDKGDLTPRLKKAADVLGILSNVTTVATATLPGLTQATNLMHLGLAAAFKFLGGS